jgi:hypothetical protein
MEDLRSIGQLIIEYYDLISLPQLNDTKAQELAEILSLAENNPELAFLINEIDFLSLKQAGMLEKEQQQKYEQQAAIILQKIKALSPCDNACPSLETMEAVDMQNCGCLPCYYEIQQMLKNKQVWMCHSNLKKPCVATGLTQVPEGFQERTEY